MMNKEQIETEKTYEDCSVILKEFDEDNYQFSKDVETLINAYADAAKNVNNLEPCFEFYKYLFESLIASFFSLARQCGIMVTNARRLVY